jgi:hypothetical protein
VQPPDAVLPGQNYPRQGETCPLEHVRAIGAAGVWRRVDRPLASELRLGQPDVGDTGFRIRSQLVVDLTVDESGRPEGSVADANGNRASFSGWLELWASVAQLVSLVQSSEA